MDRARRGWGYLLLVATLASAGGCSAITGMLYVMGANNTPADVITTVQLPVGPQTDLSITKTGLPAAVKAGQVVVYTLTVVNNGPVDATNVQVMDLAPFGTVIEAISVTNPISP